ncbi:mitochondrial inner membrane protease subunit 2-like isoform X2 [Ostrea edulis]|uniref:mitochondrial inner membrane protease subunit 2-like isoform X2 n=1 Tax=Ostrea edulis TaxID=37623 RepID=UPI0020963344|nr:mitochondrial inner membrane protease subunit 2-like isoform X2 [Ostrea edulis]
METLIKLGKIGLGVGMTVIPGTYAFTESIGYVARVDGVSMQETLNPSDSRNKNDYVFLSKSNNLLKKGNIRHGDIVSIKSPRHHDKYLIKRIVGLEGDIVKIPENTKIASRWDNPKGVLNYSDRTIQIPMGHCWVEGDNAKRSEDSNMFGPDLVGLGHIVAKATHIVWPVERWTKLGSTTQN